MEVVSTISLLTSLEIKSFHLFPNPQESHLDPIYAIYRWIHEARIVEGYIFRRITTDDQLNSENKSLVCHLVWNEIYFIADVL